MKPYRKDRLIVSLQDKLKDREQKIARLRAQLPRQCGGCGGKGSGASGRCDVCDGTGKVPV